MYVIGGGNTWREPTQTWGLRGSGSFLLWSKTVLPPWHTCDLSVLFTASSGYTQRRAHTILNKWLTLLGFTFHHHMHGMWVMWVSQNKNMRADSSLQYMLNTKTHSSHGTLMLPSGGYVEHHITTMYSLKLHCFGYLPVAAFCIDHLCYIFIMNSVTET